MANVRQLLVCSCNVSMYKLLLHVLHDCMSLWVDSMNKMTLNILQSSESVSFPFDMVLFTVDLYTGSLHPSNTQSCMNERLIVLKPGECEMLQQEEGCQNTS